MLEKCQFALGDTVDWLLFAKETDTLGGLRFDFPKKEISSRPFFSVCAFFRHQQQQQQQQ